MIHLRIVSPEARTDRALELLTANAAVCNIITLRGTARRPDGDVILCDVASEEASVVLSDLRGINLHLEGSIAVERIDTEISAAADRAERAAPGAPGDAVLWEEVSSRTSEDATLSMSFLAFMVMATLIASVGIYLESPILIVGAMVVGPEFGPLAGLCVAIVHRRPKRAVTSLVALVVGFPLGISAAWLATLAFKATDVIPAHFSEAENSLAHAFANPDTLSFFVAFCAGIAGMVSLTTAKSGALIGVLISVTTIPAAANIGVSLAYEDWPNWRGSQQQLLLNLSAICLAGVLTLVFERLRYARRRRRHVTQLGA